jgi:hypothetical protein
MAPETGAARPHPRAPLAGASLVVSGFHAAAKDAVLAAVARLGGTVVERVGRDAPPDAAIARSVLSAKYRVGGGRAGGAGGGAEAGGGRRDARAPRAPTPSPSPSPPRP